MKWGKPAPVELIRWSLVERFGWTLPDIDAMSVEDLHQLYQIDDGRAKAK